MVRTVYPLMWSLLVREGIPLPPTHPPCWLEDVEQPEKGCPIPEPSHGRGPGFKGHSGEAHLDTWFWPGQICLWSSSFSAATTPISGPRCLPPALIPAACTSGFPMPTSQACRLPTLPYGCPGRQAAGAPSPHTPQPFT